MLQKMHHSAVCQGMHTAESRVQQLSCTAWQIFEDLPYQTVPGQYRNQEQSDFLSSMPPKLTTFRRAPLRSSTAHAHAQNGSSGFQSELVV